MSGLRPLLYLGVLFSALNIIRLALLSPEDTWGWIINIGVLIYVPLYLWRDYRKREP